MKTRSPFYLALCVATCLWAAVSSRYGYSLFDNPLVRRLPGHGNSVLHK